MSTCRTPLARIYSTTKPFHQQPLSTSTKLLPYIQSRHESTTRRHKKRLHVQEAPSYTPDRNATTLIFNPPSAAPNVYHTPLKFLPKQDKRRQLYASAQPITSNTTHLRNRTSPIAAPGTPLATQPHLPPRPSASLPPPVRAPYEKKYHLGEEEIEEIRRLRGQDPDKWTRVRLAEKFGCSQFFVGMVVKNEDKAERVAEEHRRARERWGERRRLAREDRVRRREMWGRDV